MVFGVKNRQIVSVTFHSCRGFAQVANVAAFFLAANNMYGDICLTGSRKFIHSVIIWEQDSAVFF